jgi:hypothetical protein
VGPLRCGFVSPGVDADGDATFTLQSKLFAAHLSVGEMPPHDLSGEFESRSVICGVTDLSVSLSTL